MGTRQDIKSGVNLSTMTKEEKEKIISEFVNKLEVENVDGGFGVFCLKCGSQDIENSYDGEGGCVAPQSYTADFNGKHFIKCLKCGNATTNEFYVSINGICG